jgi:hypothetical protein
LKASSIIAKAASNERPGFDLLSDELNAFDHQPRSGAGVDVPESRTMDGGGKAGSASDGGEKEGVGRGASRHADQHGQSGVKLGQQI